MATVFLHFVAGTLGSLAVFLAFIRLSGTRGFSAPFGVIFIGIACAALAHFVSVWATPAVIAAYALFSAIEFRQGRNLASPSPDSQVIEQLRKAGSNLGKAHDIEFFLYFPGKEQAEAAQKDLQGQGFTSEVRRASKGPDWLLFLTRSMRPAEPALREVRATLSSTASRHGGTYDGWGAQVVE